ncbi:MAG: type II toxin-antitoxin system Phd/YefM family antitoxin [Candidatus Paracaedibacteraceae bacterium]|nr:type II toxin-antitoxin system Phd/YefM family antitoxin [Candidatus Paracaedibacteraceae bacterium]
MLQIGIGEFKAKCLKLMDENQLKRETIIITKRGKPIAKVTAYEQEPIRARGWMAGTVQILGDIVESTGEKWDAETP